MMMTINISLPKSMYEDAKKLMKKKHYASISEFVRAVIRKELHPELTENGFTPEFEEAVLRSAASPDVDDILETDEDVHRFFDKLRSDIRAEKRKKKNGKN